MKAVRTSHHQTEARLLQACAGSDVEERASIALVQAGINWDYFFRLARRHSLVPLVYKQLESSIRDQVPAEVLQRFKKNYQENAARNVVLTEELISLIELLAENGIEAIAFKGPALAMTAYRDLNLRRFIDLDLIVQRADMPSAIDLLRRRGYQAARSLDAEQQQLLLRTQHNLQFTRGRVIVELHWQIASHLFAASVTAEELWQNLETLEINGRTVKTLAPEDLLFALCVHGSRHVWEKLAWISDLDRIVRTQPHIDWQRLLDRARRANAERMFLLGLAFANRLLGTPLPQVIADAISRDERIPGLVSEIRERLFDGPEAHEMSFRTVFRFNFLIRTDWRSRFSYCRFLLSPSDSDLETFRLSKPLHFAYYLLRPFRLLRSAASRRSESSALTPSQR